MRYRRRTARRSFGRRRVVARRPLRRRIGYRY